MTPRKRSRGLDELLAEQAEPPKPAERPEDTKPHKFTMLNDAQDHARVERVVEDVVQRSGIRVTKRMRADVFRALIDVAAEDANLREAVAARLRERAG